MSQLNDISLVAQVVVFHNTKAFDQLVKKYQSPVRRFFLHQTCGDGELSDDLAQDTFIKAYTNIASFKNLSSFSTWLYRIAINESLDFLRRHKMATLSSADADLSVANRLMADDYFDGDKSQALLQEAIASLPDVQRTVFTLRYYDEMKYSEMSEVLGTSEGALKASYHIAVQKITDYVKRYE